jgi:hypothetical protein
MTTPWRRFLRGWRADVAPASVTPIAREDAVAAAAPEPVEQLWNAPESAAVALFKSFAGTAAERRALDIVHARQLAGTAPIELSIAAAAVLVQRGERAEALALCEELDDLAAQLLCADVHADEGDLVTALMHVERVLARDIARPGARERHGRWSAQSGVVASRPQPGATLVGVELASAHLRVVGEAGRGGSATVYQTVDDDLGRPLALKVYHRAAADREQLLREAQLAVRFAGRGVVAVYDVDPERGWIALEWLGRGSLSHALERCAADLLCPPERWLFPLISTVAAIHGGGIVHGDIKPANVLFRAPGEPVIADFGLAGAAGSPAGGGTRGYVSPRREQRGTLLASDDVFALGRLLQLALDALEHAAMPPSASERRLRELAAAAVSDAPPEDAAALLRLAHAMALSGG